jgi:uncharacterized protein YcbK (DUF882 family)
MIIRMQRRTFLRAALCALPAVVLAHRAFADASESRPVDQSGAAAAPPEGVIAPARSLTFTNTHTAETMSAVFARGGQYEVAGLALFEHVLRDHRSGETHAMDPALYDILHELADRADAEPHYEIISGYRSPETNQSLRKHSKGVVKNSMHLQGKAIDLRLRGVDLARLHALALDLKGGGVGYYPASDFVHIDTGRVRSWSG